MSKESAALLVAQQEPQVGGESASTQPMPIVTKLPPDVKVLRDFVKRRHIPLMDMLEVVQTIYPRCDKSLLSKCIHGEETGAKLRGNAMSALMTHFQEEAPKPVKQPARMKQHRIQCRVDDTVYEALQRRLKAINLNVQDYLEHLILFDLKKQSKEASK